MAIAITVAAQTDHVFIGTKSQELAVLIAFFADTPMQPVHQASVQTSLSNTRFTDLFLSVRSHEVRSSRCSVSVLVAATSSYAGHVATLSAVPMANIPSRSFRAPMRMPISVALGKTSAASVGSQRQSKAMSASRPFDDDQVHTRSGFFP